MATRTYVRLQSEELATSLWEAASEVAAGTLDRDKIAHLLLSAHEMIAEQNRALRRGSDDVPNPRPAVVPFAARLSYALNLDNAGIPRYGRVPRTRLASSKAFLALLSLIQARASMLGKEEATLEDWNHVRAELVSIIRAYRDTDLPYLADIKD